MASGLYGALLGVVMVVLTKVAPQPAGAVIFWSLICIQLAWVAMTCWRRTGLPFATAAMINGSVVSGGLRRCRAHRPTLSEPRAGFMGTCSVVRRRSDLCSWLSNRA
jgi:hypothetical protein